MANENTQELQMILKKLDTMREDILIKTRDMVQDMLNVVEQSILSRVEKHLDKYHDRIEEVQEFFTDKIAKHELILSKHEIELHTIAGKTAAVQQQVAELEVKKDTTKFFSTWKIALAFTFMGGAALANIIVLVLIVLKFIKVN